MSFSYLELVRPANVATALADVIAGAAIAQARDPHAIGWLLVATGCLYAGGVVLNDFFDRRLDAVERPERPIPSGRVRPSSAALLGGGLLAAGVIAAHHHANGEAGTVAAIIALLVLSYDAGGKRVPVLGPLNMGACRAMNLVLGMTATPGAVALNWPVAVVPFVYIVAITTLSRGEVHGGRRPVAIGAFAAMTVVVGVLAAVALWGWPLNLLSIALAAVLAWRVLPPYWRACRDSRPETVRRAVRTGILSLVLLDATLAAIYAEPVYAVAVLGVGLLAAALARLFAVT